MNPKRIARTESNRAPDPTAKHPPHRPACAQSRSAANATSRDGAARATRHRVPWLTWGFAALTLALLTQSLPAAPYVVGDLATNFSFTARAPFTRPDGTAVPAGARVFIQDFAGRVVFLEWFAVWCPYCVAAAPQVHAGIVDWYGQRGGNPHGVPVLQVAVNQESRSIYQAQTDSFVINQNFGITLNDYDATTTNAVKKIFNPTGQPVFVAINCVTNSPSHPAWQVLVNHLGYGETDFNLELANFRAIIDTVQGPSPRLTAPRRADASDFEFELAGLAGARYRVETSVTLTNWTPWLSITNTNSLHVLRDSGAATLPWRFYRAVRP